MKNFKYITLGLLIIGLSSCLKTDFDEYAATDSGSANFSNYIAVGNSLTQGYQDGGLHNEYQQQDNSYPAIIAKQMGTSFVQPTVIGSAGSGYKSLKDLAPTVVDIAGASGFNAWDNTKKYNNLGIAGIRLTDCVPTAGNPLSPAINQVITSNNPFGKFMNFGASPFAPVSYLQRVKESNATFFTCWLGNNDVLGWATNGGDNGAITVPGIGTINTSELTPVSDFRNKYDSILDAFKNMGAKGVCATLPDVTAIPFFTTVPYNPIPMDQPTADAVNAGYAPYNGALVSLTGAGMITSAEAARRTIHFTASSTNPIVIMDESLTDLTGVDPGLIKMRPATSSDMILLTAASDIGRSFSATQIYGVSVPFADSLVLTSSEVSEVRNHTINLNSQIKASAASHGVAVVDMYEYMFTLQKGMTFSGVDYNADYIAGGSFSLDGVHPNTRGYAIIANKFIEVINATYGSNLRPVIVQNYRGIIFP